MESCLSAAKLMRKAFQMRKDGVFFFVISSLVQEISKLLYYANFKIDDVISG